MRKLDVCDMEEFSRLKSSEKTIAILGDRWWPQTTKQDRDRISKQCISSIYGRSVMSTQMLEVSIRTINKNGAPSPKEHVANDRMTKWQAIYEYPPTPPAPSYRYA